VMEEALIDRLQKVVEAKAKKQEIEEAIGAVEKARDNVSLEGSMEALEEQGVRLWNLAVRFSSPGSSLGLPLASRSMFFYILLFLLFFLLNDLESINRYFFQFDMLGFL